MNSETTHPQVFRPEILQNCRDLFLYPISVFLNKMYTIIKRFWHTYIREMTGGDLVIYLYIVRTENIWDGFEMFRLFNNTGRSCGPMTDHSKLQPVNRHFAPSSRNSIGLCFVAVNQIYRMYVIFLLSRWWSKNTLSLQIGLFIGSKVLPFFSFCLLGVL